MTRSPKFECVMCTQKKRKRTVKEEEEGPGNLWAVVFIYIYACRKGLFIIARAPAITIDIELNI